MELLSKMFRVILILAYDFYMIKIPAVAPVYNNPKQVNNLYIS
jgi:hypothetical protein